jgi:hypothetical protein
VGLVAPVWRNRPRSQRGPVRKARDRTKYHPRRRLTDSQANPGRMPGRSQTPRLHWNGMRSAHVGFDGTRKETEKLPMMQGCITHRGWSQHQSEGGDSRRPEPLHRRILLKHARQAEFNPVLPPPSPRFWLNPKPITRCCLRNGHDSRPARL